MTRPLRASRGSAGPPSVALARRLRELRETGWPDRAPITQKTLSEAFGLALSSISAYETEGSLPDRRLRDYATFFSTRRSVDDGSPRILPDPELAEHELAERDRLLRELRELQEERSEPEAETDESPAGLSTWTFPAGDPVRIICGQLTDMNHPYSNPEAWNYTKLLNFADADALVELFGHVRMCNPSSDVRFMQASEFGRPDDLACHLVMLGGTGLNLRLQELLDRTALPIEQVEDSRVKDGELFLLRRSGAEKPVLPGVQDGKDAALPEFSSRKNVGLVGDVGLFARVANPYNTTRTLTWCSGIYSRGVYGAVRTLTDAQYREQNEAHLRKRFGKGTEFAILMRVPVLFGDALTPDLTNESTRLYEWPEKPAVEEHGRGRVTGTGHAREAGTS
jgi:hypothetical protein